MAKSDKQAVRTIQVTSSLPADRLAGICKEAAEQCTAWAAHGKAIVTLVEVTTGKLRFSVRNRHGKLEYLSFEVHIAEHDDRRVMVSRILRYKTTQRTWAYLIPFGPKTIMAFDCYEQFMRRTEELVRQADPEARVVVAG